MEREKTVRGDADKATGNVIMSDSEAPINTERRNGVIDALLRLFVNRRDTFATQGLDGTYVRLPEPLTRDVLFQHIAAECNRSTGILHLDDYDPSGLDIERDLENRLSRYGAGDFKVERIALTQEQTQHYQLPPMPAKISDPRLASFIADTGGIAAVELDALPPNVLQDMVRNAILGHIDGKKWNARTNQIRYERKKVR